MDTMKKLKLQAVKAKANLLCSPLCLSKLGNYFVGSFYHNSKFLNKNELIFEIDHFYFFTIYFLGDYGEEIRWKI